MYFTGTVYWITGVMVVYGSLPQWVAMPVNASLIATLALFPALFAVVVRRSVMAFGPRAVMAAPLVWVATELGRTYFFSGFPWVLLGYSQANGAADRAAREPLRRVRRVGARRERERGTRDCRDRREAEGGLGQEGGVAGQAQWVYGPVAVAVTLVVMVAGVGSRRAATAEWTKTGDPLRVGLVQGNVDQAKNGMRRGPRRSSPTTSGMTTRRSRRAQTW